MRYLVIISIFAFVSCSKPTPVEPGPSNPRDYTWQKDSVGDGSYPMTATAIWASAPNDIFLTVWAGGSLFTGKIWHYNGSTWNDFTTKYIEAFPAQTIYQFEPEGVYGFSKNDVWIVGTKDTSYVSNVVKRGFAMHYNGSTWEGFSSPEILGLLTVWGKSSSDLWAGGYLGAIYHYNGSSWQRFSLGDSNFVEIINGVAGNEVYATAFYHDNSIPKDYTTLHRWDGLSWTTIDSTDQNNFDLRFTVADGTIYSAFGNQVVRRLSSGVWQTAFQASGGSFWWIWSSSVRNIFVIGGGNGENIYHYNGYDWARFRQFIDPSNVYYRMCGVNGEIFIVGEALNNMSPMYILHGK